MNNIKNYLIVAIVSIFVTIGGCLLGIVCLFNPAPTAQFNTNGIQDWCGKADGGIRMIGAEAKDNNTFIDTDGNEWVSDRELDTDAFYLLWLDDKGTQNVKDDAIIKVWREV